MVYLAIFYNRATGKIRPFVFFLPSQLLNCLFRIYIPAIYVLNKIDQISIEELDLIYKIPNAVPICAHHEWNFDELLETMWKVRAVMDVSDYLLILTDLSA